MLFKIFATLFGIGLAGMLGLILIVAIPIILLILVVWALFFK